MVEKSMQNNRKPALLVIAGPNGSGKSTITSYFDVIGEYRKVSNRDRNSC